MAEWQNVDSEQTGRITAQHVTMVSKVAKWYMKFINYLLSSPKGDDFMVVFMAKYVLGTDRQWEAERIADVIHTKLSEYPGFIKYILAEENEIGEYISLGFWETQEQALRAHAEIHQFVIDVLLDHECDRIIEVFNVYLPKILQ